MTQIIKRDLEDELMKWIDNKEIIAIRGPRQSGKTTLLGELKKKIDSDNITYINFEDDFEKEKFEKNPKEYVSYYLKEGNRNYLFFDEVQYVNQAGKLLKLIFDSFDNLKIIVTGSSTLDLNEIGSYLVGRVLLFELYPFSFSEFLLTKNEKLHSYYKKNCINLENTKIRNKALLFQDKLNKELEEYIAFGAYPAVVMEKQFDKKKTLLKNLVQTYIEKDIIKLYGLQKKQKIIDLIRYLASVNGNMINYNEICSDLSLYQKELKEILSILEQTYIIKSLKPFHKNLVTELKKNPKIYFIDTGLRNTMAERYSFNEQEKGILFENCLVKRFINHKLNYWRTTSKAEVDIVVDQKIPIESKTTFKITRSFRSYIDTYNPNKAFITNMKTFEKIKIGKTEVIGAPLSLFL